MTKSWRPTYYLYAQRRFEDKAQAAFERLGLWVATHRWFTLAGGFLFIALCGVGFLNFEVLSDGDKLWAPSQSTSVNNQKTVEKYFGDDDAFAQLLFRTDDGAGSSVLTLSSFEQIWAADQAVRAAEYNGMNYEDLCVLQPSGPCDTFGPLRFWDGDYDTYQAQVTTEAELLAALSNSTFPDGSEVGRDQIFGLYEESPDGSLISAQAVILTYSLDGTAHSKGTLEEWESKYLDEAKASTAALESPLEGFYIADRSLDDELARSIGGETYLFVLAFILMILFVQLQLGKFDRVRGRKGLAFAGVVTVVLAGFAAYGVCSGFGVPFTSLVQIFPFILLGVGVDDMLIITAHFDEEDPALPVNERVSKALGKCGLSITYTSLSSWLAFALGGFPQLTQLPAVRYFCWYASTSFLFDFFLQITVFVALLCFDADRMAANKLDILCCKRSKRPLPEEPDVPAANSSVVADASASATAPVTSAEGSEAGFAAGSSGGTLKNPMRSPMNRWFFDYYGPFLMRTPVKMAVVAVTLGFLGVCIWGVTQVGQGFSVLDLVPDDSYARSFTDNARAVNLYLEDTFVPVGIYYQAVDYTDADVQAAILTTEQRALAQQHCGGPLSSWLDSFIAWAADSSDYSDAIGSRATSSALEEVAVFDDPSPFYAALDEYLATEDGLRFTTDIVFDASGDAITISRSSLFYVDVAEASAQKQALLDIRDAICSVEGLDPAAFSYSAFDLYTEQYLVLIRSVLADFGVALAAVGLLSFLVLGRIRYTIMVTILVGIADVMLIGSIYFWGLQINTITGVQLVMAAGLIIDYVAHPVGHIVRTSEKLSVAQRVQLGLGEIGPSVLLGGCTTLLGILPMAGAGNAIFRTFFRVFLCIILYGLFFGLVAAPVIVTWIPFPVPPPGLERHHGLQSTAAGKDTNGKGKPLFLNSVTVVGSVVEDEEEGQGSAAEAAAAATAIGDQRV